MDSFFPLIFPLQQYRSDDTLPIVSFFSPSQAEIPVYLASSNDSNRMSKPSRSLLFSGIEAFLCPSIPPHEFKVILLDLNGQLSIDNRYSPSKIYTHFVTFGPHHFSIGLIFIECKGPVSQTGGEYHHE